MLTVGTLFVVSLGMSQRKQKLLRLSKAHDPKSSMRGTGRIFAMRFLKHDMQDVLKPQAKTKARLELRRGRERESTQLLPDLEKEVTSTVPAPIQGNSSSSTGVLVNSSVAASVSVEDVAQTSVLISSDVIIQLASSGAVGSLCFSESKARDCEKMTDLVPTSHAFPGRPSRDSA